MFDAVGKTADLAVQLVYFRGMDEGRASKMVINTRALRDLMLGTVCLAGQTQISKILKHAVKETTQQQVSALVYIGDAIEEGLEGLFQKAGELGVRGIRCFFFQDGQDIIAERGFREMARLTEGAYFQLGPDSADFNQARGNRFAAHFHRCHLATFYLQVSPHDTSGRQKIYGALFRSGDGARS